MGKWGKKKVEGGDLMVGNLEVVSQESFKQRREGMSSCLDCMKERSKEHDNTKLHGRSYKPKNKVKSSSPIVVRLRDTIKVSVKGKMKASPSSSDQDSDSGSDDCPGSLTSSSSSSPSSSPGYDSKDTEQAKWLDMVNDVNDTTTVTKSNVTKGEKNFTAFLTAIEKNHFKKQNYVSNLDNLEQFVQSSKDDLADKGDVGSVLNNAVQCNSVSGKGEEAKNNLERGRGTGNVDLICNDLHSNVSTVESSSSVESSDDIDVDCSENSSVVSSSESQPDGLDGAGTGKGEAQVGVGAASRTCPPPSREDVQDLGKEELEQLADYTTGCNMAKYDCLPHECPACMAVYYAHSHYYAQNSSEAFKFEVVDDGIGQYTTEDISNGNISQEHVSSNNKTDIIEHDQPQFKVTVKEKGHVEVSVAGLHKEPHTTSSSSSQSSSAPSSPKTHKTKTSKKSKTKSSSAPSSPSSTSFHHSAHQPLMPFNTVSVDLTDSQVTYSVYYEPQEEGATAEDVSPMYPADYYVNFYMSMFGYIPYFVPYYLVPMPYFPPLVIPKPLCVPRNLKCLSSQRLPLVPAHEIKNFTGSQPPQRPWLPLAHPATHRPIAIYTVMCYNVLCDKYATRQLYGYCPSWALSWEYRKKAIMEEIRQYNADILSLQEVETEQFYNFFLPELKRDGYDGIFSPKSRARTMSESERKHVDGCAIFFRTTKFTLKKEHLIEFNQLAINAAEGSHEMINRVMTKDNIGLAALLETKEATWENGLPPADQICQPVLIATCHVHWDPEYCDVKLIQTMMLMSELKNIVEETQISFRPGSTVSKDVNSIPLLLCGDLNSLPESGVVEFLNKGKVGSKHQDFKDLGYQDCLQKLSDRDIYSHCFKLAQAYNKDVMPYTNYTFDFKGIIDYIFYTRELMRPLGVLGPLDPEWFRESKVQGCPHPHIPSDHLPLLVEIEMTPSQISTTSLTNSAASSASSVAPPVATSSTATSSTPSTSSTSTTSSSTTSSNNTNNNRGNNNTTQQQNTAAHR